MGVLIPLAPPLGVLYVMILRCVSRGGRYRGCRLWLEHR